MMDASLNYFKSSVHYSDFLACEFRQPAQILESDRNRFGEASICRLQLIDDFLFDGAVWWGCHF